MHIYSVCELNALCCIDVYGCMCVAHVNTCRVMYDVVCVVWCMCVVGMACNGAVWYGMMCVSMFCKYDVI